MISWNMVLTREQLLTTRAQQLGHRGEYSGHQPLGQTKILEAAEKLAKEKKTAYEQRILGPKSGGTKYL